jgi:uncharacterized protein YdhG (YjbR/CyaY superfamily)
LRGLPEEKDMTSTASTVGAYLRDLPPDRRVAMARLCSMIRRSARGVRESMRYGLAFYELDGPLFALESGRRHMSLYVAEKDVVLKHKDALTGVNAAKSFIKFSDLNRLPLDVVERIVRDSVAARRQRLASGSVPTQAELLKLWDIKEEDAAPPAKTVKLAISKPAAAMTDAINAMAHSMRDAMVAAIDIATGNISTGNGKAPIKPRTAKKKMAAKKSTVRIKKKSATRPPPKKSVKKGSAAARRR